MKAFLEYLVKQLVDKPDEVEIREINGEKTIVFELRVGDGDIGKVIGRNGQTARSLRTLVSAVAAKAGDVVLFSSDVWHRRMPSGDGDTGRFFVQIHYGRRDIAQRLRTTAEANHLSDETIARAAEDRERTALGLHDPFFYDG